MSSKVHLEGLFLTFQSLLFFALPIAAFIVFAVLYAAHSNANPSVPLYVPETSAAGNQKKRWMFDSVSLLQEAYKKFYGKPFRVWTTEGVQFVIPPDYVDELKMLLDHTFPSALRNVRPIEPSKLDYGHVVMKNDLNKNMGRVFPEVRDEVGVVFPLEFPECKDWFPIQVYPKVLRLVSRVNGKIFVGNGLHQNEEWIKISCNYTRNVFLSSAKLRFFHPWLRPIVQYFIPELRTVWKCNAKARELLAPIIQQRATQERNEDYKKPNDAIEWLRELIPELDKNDPHFHGISQLGIGAVSVNTTSQLITNAIFNLATYPEYVPILKEEIDSVLEESGGEWTLESMGKLKKLDSFMKETLRYNGHLTATFQRKALRPITLSDGTYIPSGTFTFPPVNAISFDPNIYPDANTFDGLRFYHLRQASLDDEKKYQLTSITKTQMQFGSGRHACPGRWFASHQIKLVLAAMIDQYELKLKDGEGRPKSIVFQINQFPDPKAEIMFKNKKYGDQGGTD